jgi:hypothetical protein
MVTNFSLMYLKMCLPLILEIYRSNYSSKVMKLRKVFDLSAYEVQKILEDTRYKVILISSELHTEVTRLRYH